MKSQYHLHPREFHKFPNIKYSEPKFTFSWLAHPFFFLEGFFFSFFGLYLLKKLSPMLFLLVDFGACPFHRWSCSPCPHFLETDVRSRGFINFCPPPPSPFYKNISVVVVAALLTTQHPIWRHVMSQTLFLCAMFGFISRVRWCPPGPSAFHLTLNVWTSHHHPQPHLGTC